MEEEEEALGMAASGKTACTLEWRQWHGMAHVWLAVQQFFHA